MAPASADRVVGLGRSSSTSKMSPGEDRAAHASCWTVEPCRWLTKYVLPPTRTRTGASCPGPRRSATDGEIGSESSPLTGQPQVADASARKISRP